VALAGNPNAGKTSIFNALTGARQHVGNYPGVTVEKRTGRYPFEGASFDVLDLPGTYSLSSFSPEERITQHELLSTEHDVVVVVADSTNLKRSLVLLAQVLQTGAKTVLCLNMADEARKAGQKIDLGLMQTLLGVPVVETVGHQAHGMDALRRAIAQCTQGKQGPHRLVLGERLDSAIGSLRPLLSRLPLERAEQAGQDWVATKLLSGDADMSERIRLLGPAGKRALERATELRNRIEKETGSDLALYLTERYFGFVDGLLREVVAAPARGDARALSDAIDAVVVHRVLGLPIFALVMYAIFWLTFRVGEPLMTGLETALGALRQAIGTLWPAAAAPLLRSLLIDGVLGGVGGVVVFLPNIALLFFGLGLLEDTGYMARAAFLMDRVMHRFGLHGKSFVPMMAGFGCSVPGILATRTLENERDRLTTMLVLPLMSCGARLPAWLLIIPAFFAPAWRAPLLGGIYATGVVLALVLARLLRSSLLRGEEAPFVMELPPYRWPTMRALGVKMFERSWLYLRKAATIILAVSILMWLCTEFPKPASYAVDGDISAGRVVVAAGHDSGASPQAEAQPQGSLPSSEQALGSDGRARPEILTASAVESRRRAEALRYSIAGRLGQAVEPLVRPLGLDWKIATCLIGAVAAKELFVAQVGIVYAVGSSGEAHASLRDALRRDYSPAAALALMLLLLIATPCVATVAATRRESNSWKWALLQFGGLSALGYLVALIAFQLGRLVLGA